VNDIVTPKRQSVRIQSPRLRALLSGELKVQDLDDEELARGYPRAEDGTFRGRPPMMIPRVMQDEMTRRLLSRGQEVLKQSYIKAMENLTNIASDPNVDAATRARTSQYLVERLAGKTPEVIHVAAEDPVESLFKSILADPLGKGEMVPVPKEPSKDELTDAPVPDPVEF
jgi:hypothetical protein